MSEILNDLHGILRLYKLGRVEEAWKELYLQVPQFQKVFIKLVAEGTIEEKQEMLIILEDLFNAMQKKDKVLVVDVITYAIFPIFKEKCVQD